MKTVNAALPPPLPSPPARRRPLFLAGCAAGCLGVFLAFILGAALLVLAALQLPPFDPKLPRGALPVPREYVGTWQSVDDPSSTLTIHPDGKGDCDIHHRGGAYRMLGGRIHYDPAHRLLSLKFLIFGPSWHVDDPPHAAEHGSEMKLNGRPYRRIGNVTEPGETRIHLLRDETMRNLRLLRNPFTKAMNPRQPPAARLNGLGFLAAPATCRTRSAYG
ncbi:MAG TPA: hypothetical protein VGD78_09515 [Chthoniobacterales bacterium]